MKWVKLFGLFLLIGVSLFVVLFGLGGFFDFLVNVVLVFSIIIIINRVVSIMICIDCFIEIFFYCCFFIFFEVGLVGNFIY